MASAITGSLMPALLFLSSFLLTCTLAYEETVNCRDFYHLHDCDPQAICVNTVATEGGYSSTPSAQCKCPVGFTDMSPNKAQAPGRKCTKAVNECLDPRSNDCDRSASCIDTTDSYYCRCPSGTIDASPDKSRPGRRCSPIQQASINDCSTKCSPNADCNVDVVTYTGVKCRCKAGFVDSSPNLRAEPGLVCTLPAPITYQVPAPVTYTAPRNIRCDPASPPNNDCDRNAICYTRGTNDYTCACKYGYKDRSPQPSVFPGRLCDIYAPKCPDPNKNDCDTPDKAVCTDNIPANTFTCQCRPGFRDISPSPTTAPGRKCEVIRSNPCEDGTHDCDKNADCIPTTYRKRDVKGGGYTCRCKPGFLEQSPDPKNKPGRTCVVPPQEQPPVTAVPLMSAPCGNTTCNETLNEVCVKGKCVCPENNTRSDPGEKCVAVIKTPLAVRIGQQDGKPLFYAISDYGDPRNPVYVSLADQFKNDTGTAIQTTSYEPRYVNTDVKQLTHPRAVNASWNDGVLVNFTVNTLASAGAVDPCDLWDKLMEAVKKTDGAIGGGNLKLAPQNELLDPCIRSKNECELNATICPLNTQCVNLEIGYKCVCIKGFLDVSPKVSPSGSVCKPDFCSDVQYCTVNATCINQDNGYVCQCKAGFVDISAAPALNETAHSVDDSTCLRPRDVNVCALGLDNCTAPAICVPLRPVGFKCQCPEGWTDGDLSNPGQQCAQAQSALAMSKLPIILLIILALLFLCLALCCCLYLCSRCRCFRRRRGLLDQSSVSDSGLYDQMRIPRAQLYDADSLKSDGSEYTVREEVERRVTTDVTRTELHSSDAGAEGGGHDVMDTQRAWSTRHEYYPSDYTARRSPT